MHRPFDEFQELLETYNALLSSPSVHSIYEKQTCFLLSFKLLSYPIGVIYEKF